MIYSKVSEKVNSNFILSTGYIKPYIYNNKMKNALEIYAIYKKGDRNHQGR